jgi:Uncharacterized conserved protein (COG2071)
MIPRIVSAHLVERFIVNFRLPADALRERLPAEWLEPQVLAGWSVASFCVLKLDRMTLWPLPPLVRIQTISCAYRCGVIDTSGTEPEPSVYITDRNTDRSLIARLGPLIFSDTIPPVHAAIARSEGTVEVSVSHMDGQRLFSVDLHPPADPSAFESDVFGSLDEFKAFIGEGKSSYTPSTHVDRLARVDLAKEDVRYEPLNAEVDFSSLENLWRDAGLVYDSAVRATGGRYRWTYRGLRKTLPEVLPHASGGILG